MTPTFSIIVPTYNQDSFLPAALDSILAQTCPDWEAVVVNDGSTDNTKAILEDYAARDQRIRVVHKPNGGVSSALNRGLAEATGEWINWLSSDDLFEPNRLELNLEHIRRRPDVDFFYSYFKILRERTGQIEEHDLWGPRPTPNHEIIGLFYRNYISGITICIRRSVWESVGRFNEELYYAQDYEMWLRLLRHAKLDFIDRATVINRNHDAQGSEVFQAACFFDSALGTIQTLNEVDLQSLVPFVDLSDPEALTGVMDSVMKVAADPTSYVYRLGSTPLLPARLAEFLWSPDASAFARGLRTRFLSEAGELAARHENDDFGLMWSLLRSNLATADHVSERFTVDPHELTYSTHARLAAAGDPQAHDIERYIREQLKLPVAPVGKSPPGRVLLLGRSGAEDLAKCARELSKNGVITVRSGHGLGQDRLGYTISFVGNEQAPERLPMLGRFDVAASLSSDDLPWTFGDQRLELQGPAKDWARRIRLRLPVDRTPEHSCEPKKTRVLMVGLSPWGGGAESVMASLVTGLDRERFCLEIACLYRAENPGDYPRDSVIRILSDGSEWTYASPANGLVATAAGPGAGTLEASVQRAKVDKVLSRLAEKTSPSVRVLLKRLGALHVLGSIRYAEGLAKRGVRAVLRRVSTARAMLIAGFARLNACLSGYLAPFLAESRWLARPSDYHEKLWRSRYKPMLQQLAELLSRSEDGVVVSFMEHAAILVHLAKTTDRPRHIISLHTNESRYLPVIFPDVRDRRFVEGALHDAVTHSGEAVFPGPGCAKDLVEHLDLQPGFVSSIPNPVNLARIRYLASLAPKTEDLDRWIAGRKVFVSLGRLGPEKNHSLQIDAVERLADRKDIAFVCIGDGVLRKPLRTEVRRRGLEDRMRFIGTMVNPFPLLSRAHGLILTSHLESFGLVLVEAMALQVPTIAVDCPYGPREVLDGGRCGMLIAMNDPAILAEAIRRVTDDNALRERLIRNGMERALEYDVTRVLPKWESAILQNGKRGSTTENGRPVPEWVAATT